MAKGKLHELLAVEGELEAAFKMIMNETKSTFSKRADHFSGHVKTYKPLDDNDIDVLPEQHKELVTTVEDKLDYMFSEHVIPYFDAVLQKEATNQGATADLIVDGEPIAAALPATFLLGLETKLRQVRDVLQQAPTLQPGIAWKEDPQRGKNIYVTEHPEETMRTKSVLKAVSLAKATKEHKEQVKEFTENQPIGKFTKTSWCGMMSPAEKSEMLKRLDNLIRSAKQARMRANQQEVVSNQVGLTLANYVMGRK